MGNDACRRAWEAMSDLCGENPQNAADKNTFYFEMIVTQGREVGPSDVDEVARALEEVPYGFLVSDQVDPDTGQPIQFIEDPGRERTQRMRGYLKIPVDRITARQVQDVRDTLTDAFQESDAAVGRSLDRIEMVDRGVVLEYLPEMVGPPMEDTRLV